MMNSYVINAAIVTQIHFITFIYYILKDIQGFIPSISGKTLSSSEGKAVVSTGGSLAQEVFLVIDFADDIRFHWNTCELSVDVRLVLSSVIGSVNRSVHNCLEVFLWNKFMAIWSLRARIAILWLVITLLVIGKAFITIFTHDSKIRNI